MDNATIDPALAEFCGDMATQLRALFSRAAGLADARLPAEDLRRFGLALARCDAALFGMETRPDVPLDVFVLLVQTRQALEDLVIGGASGAELQRLAREDLMTTN